MNKAGNNVDIAENRTLVLERERETIFEACVFALGLVSLRRKRERISRCPLFGINESWLG